MPISTGVKSAELRAKRIAHVVSRAARNLRPAMKAVMMRAAHNTGERPCRNS